MKIKYFVDTDTALVEFSDRPSVGTRELTENIYLELDDQGRVISLTIEHAHETAGVDDFSYQRFATVEPAL